jgi:hypothetical protein
MSDGLVTESFGAAQSRFFKVAIFMVLCSIIMMFCSSL